MCENDGGSRSAAATGGAMSLGRKMDDQWRTVAKTDLGGLLPLVGRGKVRDIYEVDAETLLFVATDRISAYDVVMENAIPGKGVILTRLSEFWFRELAGEVRNHLVELGAGKSVFDYLPAALGQEPYRGQLEGRSLLVRKHKLLPLEVIVRGYITGSAWKEYCRSGTVHGIAQPAGLRESEEFPEALFTPSTKAEQGAHDENITPAQAAELVGEELCGRVAALAVRMYTKCKEYARGRGIIIADTKFEFGIDEATNELVLVDEVLTPDSSRFWNAAGYAVSRAQESYDKQFLRDWLTANKLNGVEGVRMPEEIVHKTRSKYIEAYEALTGCKWE